MEDRIKSLNILYNGYKKVAIISIDGQMIVDNVIEVWTDHDKMISKYGKDANYSLEVFLKVIDFVIRKKYEIRICGLSDEPVLIHHDEFECIKDEIDKVCIMMGYIERKIDIKYFADEFKNKVVYFIGRYPELSKKNSTFGVYTVKSKNNNSEMIPVFINKEHAEKYNKNNYDITETTLHKLVHFWDNFGVLIEPDKKYWVEIPPSETSLL